MHKNKEINLAALFMTDRVINIFMLIRLNRKILFSALLFIVLIHFSPAQQFNNRSRFEKHWALLHPFAAFKVKKIYQKANEIYSESKKYNLLDNFENGGKLDAYRHIFFMAAFAQKINAGKVKKLGIAHEKGNYLHFKKSIHEHGEVPDSLSSVMDFHNNDIGIKTGKTNKRQTLSELSALCITEIKKGNAVYFKRSTAGAYLTCQDEEIDLSAYKGNWHIPKCLIATNK